MDIGQPQRVINVEPLELPAGEPGPVKEPSTMPAAEPVEQPAVAPAGRTR